MVAGTLNIYSTCIVNALDQSCSDDLAWKIGQRLYMVRVFVE